MPTDPLENLLRQADAAHPPAIASHHDLATGARAASRRNFRRRRVMEGVMAIVLCSAAIALMTLHRSARKIAVTSIGYTAAPQTLADRNELEVQRGSEERLIETMLAVEQRDAKQRVLSHSPNVNVLHRLEDERELSALVVLQGVANPLEKSEVAMVYRRVMDGFPGTGAAMVAERQLSQLH
jgi:hypothetical protein